MSTFDQSFSNIHFSSQCLFFERVVPRKFHKIHKKIYMPALFFNKVAGGKKTPEQVHSCACCIILKNNCLLEHVKTAASDILGYPYLGGGGGGLSSAKSILSKCTVFSGILAIAHFKLIESCTTSGV